jgi:hypothetical protein
MLATRTLAMEELCGDQRFLTMMIESHFGFHRVYMMTKMGPSIAFMLALSNLIWDLIRLT